jgi:hypothetical protein
MMHPQAGLDASATWLDFHLTGWFEFIESGAPYRMKLGTIGRKRFLWNTLTPKLSGGLAGTKRTQDRPPAPC